MDLDDMRRATERSVTVPELLDRIQAHTTLGRTALYRMVGRVIGVTERNMFRLAKGERRPHPRTHRLLLLIEALLAQGVGLPELEPNADPIPAIRNLAAETTNAGASR